MRSVIFGFVAAALVSATTAQAAEDAGLSLQNYRSTSPRSGVGAQFALKLKLDDRRVVRDSERVELGFAAGPVMAVQDSTTGTIRRGIGQMAGFSLRPGHSATLNLAGQPVLKRYTLLGAAEEAKDEEGKPEKKNRKGPSTLGWIGIGAGVAVAALGAFVGYFAIRCRDDRCSE